MAMFRDTKYRKTELRVITINADNPDHALIEADKLMRTYSRDFEFEYSGIVNVYEFGSDLMGQYGEVFSTTWDSDEVFDVALEDRLQE